MRKVSLLSLMLALAITLNLAEVFLLPTAVIPGFKIGLANIISLIVLYIYGIKELWIVVLLRILLVAILSGSLLLPNFYMSFFAGIFSSLILMIFYSFKLFSLPALSILAAYIHVFIQMIVASIIIDSIAILLLSPYLLYLSMITGFVTGIIADKAIVILQRNQFIKI